MLRKSAAAAAVLKGIKSMNKGVKRLTLILCIAAAAVYILSRQYANRTSGDEPPRIAMVEKEVTISVTDPVESIFQGVTASDVEDGDVTESLLVESMSNMTKDLTRTAVIAAFDSAGNVTKSSRTVAYSDYTSPNITLSTPLTVQAASVSDILQGIQVTDVLDGDISDQVQLETAARVDTSVTDEYEANIIVSNSAGDTVDIPVTLTACTLSDMALAPSIELSTYLIYLNQGDDTPSWKSFLKSVTVSGRTWLWSDGAFSLEPEEDGTVSELRANETELRSSDVKAKQEVDTSTPGVYEVDYYVKAYKANPAAHVRLFVIVR